MNNEPVAWMVKTLDGKNLMLYGEEQPPKFTGEVQYIPLYTHPAKTLTDAEFDNIFANGKRLGVLETEDKFRKEKTLTDEEIEDCYQLWRSLSGDPAKLYQSFKLKEQEK